MTLVSFDDFTYQSKVLHENHRGAGVVLKLANGDVAKCFVSKGFILDFARFYLKRSKAQRHRRSAEALLEIGLLTPTPIEIVHFSKPCLYEGAYIQSLVDRAKPVSDALPLMSAKVRVKLLSEVSAQISAMVRAGLLFVDLHLGNLLIDDSGSLWWIDVELLFSARMVRKHFWQRLRRMHTKCHPELLSGVEWVLLRNLLEEQVAQYCGPYPFEA